MYEQPSSLQEATETKVQPASSPEVSSKNSSGTISILSLIVGIIAFLSSFIAIVSIPFGIAAIVLGRIGIKKKIRKGLAIAGIITGSLGILAGLLSLLLLFIALPALQKNQADTAKKNEVSAAVSAVYSYQSNNQNALPSTEQFKSDDFKQQYGYESKAGMQYVVGKNCNGETADGNFKIYTLLSNNQEYCLGS